MRKHWSRVVAFTVAASLVIPPAHLSSSRFGGWVPASAAFADDQTSEPQGFGNGESGIGAKDGVETKPLDRTIDRAAEDGTGAEATQDEALTENKADPTDTAKEEATDEQALAAADEGEEEPKQNTSPVQFSYKARQPETLGSGAFTDAVEIKVPAFRGLEPKLALQYSSSGGLTADGLRAGWIGVGWSLSGIPDIVRTAPINGTPRFNASDVYQFDGQDLVACEEGVASPSCATGGTHATKIESYERIKLAGNVWTVWSKDGTRSIFKSLSTWGTSVVSYDELPDLMQNKYRWLLATRIDPKRKRGELQLYMPYASCLLPQQDHL